MKRTRRFNSVRRSDQRAGRFHHIRRGTMLVLVAVTLLILLIAASFSVDIAYMQLARTELRAATDAAARAGAEALSREQSEPAAVDSAKSIAGVNQVAGEPLALAESDIEFGQTTMNSLGAFEFIPGKTPPNAVRVIGRRTSGSPSGPVPLFFGRVLGVSDFEPQQTAVATLLDRDIAVVVDHSLSMRWFRRWGGLQSAMNLFLSELTKTPQEEIVSLSAYSTDARRLVPLTKNPQAIKDAFKRLKPEGYTNIGGGLLAGSDSLEQDALRRPLAAKTIILMTDGQHTHGTHPLDIIDVVQQRRQTVHTITFSSGANQDLMREIAERTGGRHYHAANNGDLREVFRQIAVTLPVVLSK